MTAEQIMREERERTLAELDKLPLSPEAMADVLRACAAIQEAVNRMVADLDRAVDQRVIPAAMYLMGDEHERLSKRFVEAGLAARLQ